MSRFECVMSIMLPLAIYVLSVFAKKVLETKMFVFLKL